MRRASAPPPERGQGPCPGAPCAMHSAAAAEASRAARSPHTQFKTSRPIEAAVDPPVAGRSCRHGPHPERSASGDVCGDAAGQPLRCVTSALAPLQESDACLPCEHHPAHITACGVGVIWGGVGINGYVTCMESQMVSISISERCYIRLGGPTGCSPLRVSVLAQAGRLCALSSASGPTLLDPTTPWSDTACPLRSYNRNALAVTIQWLHNGAVAAVGVVGAFA